MGWISWVATWSCHNLKKSQHLTTFPVLWTRCSESMLQRCGLRWQRNEKQPWVFDPLQSRLQRAYPLSRYTEHDTSCEQLRHGERKETTHKHVHSILSKFPFVFHSGCFEPPGPTRPRISITMAVLQFQGLTGRRSLLCASLWENTRSENIRGGHAQCRR